MLVDSLAFARGPGLHAALVIMTFGICWRVAVFVLTSPERDVYWARKQFWLQHERGQIESYVMHAGLLIVLLGFSPHILLVRDLIGFGWPCLPIGLVWFAGAVTVITMVAVLLYRPSLERPNGLGARLDAYF